MHFRETSCVGFLVHLSGHCSSYWRTLLWLRRLLPEISQRRHKIDPKLVHLKFIMRKEHWEMFFSEYFSFPSQYHSTNAPYSFIRLPPTQYNVFLPVLQFSPVSIIPTMVHTHSFIYHRHCIMFFSQYFSFPLSVSFQQWFVLIASSTIDAV